VIIDLKDGVKLKNPRNASTISSSCGLCGKTSIDTIRQNFTAITAKKSALILKPASLPEELRNAQSDFARTGGIHAAGIFGVDGELKVAREDIGRHNAVDKAIGRAFLDRSLPLDRHLLLVSGRASFEIVQKAPRRRDSHRRCGFSAFHPRSEFCAESNQTLSGFLRPPSFNIYSHIQRVILT
jgi:FdhD protein